MFLKKYVQSTNAFYKLTIRPNKNINGVVQLNVPHHKRDVSPKLG